MGGDCLEVSARLCSPSGKSGRADQVADIFNDNKIELGEAQFREHSLDHVRGQMARALGVELDRWRSGSLDTIGRRGR